MLQDGTICSVAICEWAGPAMAVYGRPLHLHCKRENPELNIVPNLERTSDRDQS